MTRRLLFFAVAGLLLRGIYLSGYVRQLPFLEPPILDASFYDGWARALRAGAATASKVEPRNSGRSAAIAPSAEPQTRSAHIVRRRRMTDPFLATTLRHWI